MDNIVNEDFSWFEKLFPFNFLTHDYEGRPGIRQQQSFLLPLASTIYMYLQLAAGDNSKYLCGFSRAWVELQLIFFSTFIFTALVSGLGQVDIRNLVLSGKITQFNRYLLYGYEKSLHNLHDISNKTGRNYIDGYLLFNLAGYSVRTHGCLACKHISSETFISILLYSQRDKHIT